MIRWAFCQSHHKTKSILMLLTSFVVFFISCLLPSLHLIKTDKYGILMLLNSLLQEKKPVLIPKYQTKIWHSLIHFLQCVLDTLSFVEIVLYTWKKQNELYFYFSHENKDQKIKNKRQSKQPKGEACTIVNPLEYDHHESLHS